MNYMFAGERFWAVDDVLVIVVARTIMFEAHCSLPEVSGLVCKCIARQGRE